MPGRWGCASCSTTLPAFLTTRTPLVLRGMHEVERHHPKQAHYYLSVLGVDPPAQGRGLGSKLLVPMLRRCDEEAVGAYLETGTERNVRFYSRHGFRVTGKVDLPKGPPMWLMWRDPL
jgi:ribosomal protein S18 acetylase RimI-like enzyme